MDKLKRAAIVKVDVISGGDRIARGHECARQLWNHLRWCGFGFNRKYQRRGKWLGIKYKEPWPGRYGLEKAFRDHWAAVELSDRCYGKVVQEFDIAVRSWFGNLKSNPKARPPRYCAKPRPLFFDSRNIKRLKGWQFKLTVLGGHIKERHAIVRLSVRPGIKMDDIETITLQPDGTATVTYDVAEVGVSPGQRIAALDLGINNLACLAFDDGTSILYSGRGVLSSDRRYHKKEAKCKPSGWMGKGDAQSKQSKRKIGYRIKAGNKRRLAMHNVTRHLIDECVKRGIVTLIVGMVKGIRQGKDHGKAGNQKLHAWPYAEMLRQLEYKGKEVGIEVVTISEAYTSQTCHVCGTIDKSSRVHRGLYECKHCGAVLNADVNGALNILKKYLLAQGLGVEGFFAALPSLTDVASGIGADVAMAATAKRVPQIGPTFTAKFDLRNWSIAVQRSCNTGSVQEGSKAQAVVV